MEKETKERFVLFAEKEDIGKRLDVFLYEELEEYSRNYIQNLTEKKCIEIENSTKLKNSYKIKGNEKIFVSIPETEELKIEAQNIPINVVYEDSDIIVVNKSYNMVVHPAPGNYSGTLVNALLYHIKDLSSINGVARPGIVHRLDKDTSGLIIVAKNDNAHRALTDMFKEKKIKKTYIALVEGRVKKEKGHIETLMGRSNSDRKKMAVVGSNGKIAITNYELIQCNEKMSFLKVNIETGRTHQIRVHMKYINHPILGDITYGTENKNIKRQMLHAYKLEFSHPVTSEKIELMGEIPEDFMTVLNQNKFEI